MKSMVYDGFTESLKVLDDSSVRENSWNVECNRVKEENDCWLEEGNAYEIEKKKLD